MTYEVWGAVGALIRKEIELYMRLNAEIDAEELADCIRSAIYEQVRPRPVAKRLRARVIKNARAHAFDTPESVEDKMRAAMEFGRRFEALGRTEP